MQLFEIPRFKRITAETESKQKPLHSTLFFYREPDCIPETFKLLFSLDMCAYYQETQSKFI